MDISNAKQYMEDHQTDTSNIDTVVGICTGYTAYCASKKAINTIAPRKSFIQALGCLCGEVIFGVDVGTYCFKQSKKIRLACEYVMNKDKEVSSDEQY